MNFRPFILLMLISNCAAMSAAQADPRDDVLTSAARCSAIADYRKWLDCYYGAAQPLRAQLGLPPASEEQQRLSASVQGAPVPPPSQGIAATASQFGLERQDTGVPDHVTARMIDFTLDRAGNFTATLSNGQVWRQESGDTGHVRWEKSPQKMVYNVSIEHGALGSYNFRVVGQPGTYKVARLR